MAATLPHSELVKLLQYLLSRLWHRNRIFCHLVSKLLILMAQSASELARRHGTEEDRINCPFFFKIGACRHGETCTRKHNKPPFSQTVLIKKMYYNPMIPLVNSGTQVGKFDQLTLQQVFDDFLEEIVEELSKYGNLEDVQVMESASCLPGGCRLTCV